MRLQNERPNAKAALMAENGLVNDHFIHVDKMVEIGSGAKRSQSYYELSRRACYLIGINGDPSKVAAIAAIQQYFVEQTRKQEINQMLSGSGADRDRLEACLKLKETERDLKAAITPRHDFAGFEIFKVDGGQQKAEFKYQEIGIPVDDRCFTEGTVLDDTGKPFLDQFRKS